MTDRNRFDNPLRRWVLLTGSRTALAAVLSVGVVVLTGALTAAGVIYVRSGSNLSTALSSGLLSGLLTLVTVTLSINQLILSRVFGPPSHLTDRVEGAIEFRRTVEEIAGTASSPNDPDAFLAFIGETLTVLADRLRTQLGDAGDLTAEYETYVDRVEEYGGELVEANEADDPYHMLLSTLGTGYARNLTETRRIQALKAERTEDADRTLDEVLTLIQSVATMRQFFKTLTLQQDLARLSRYLIYTGVVSVLTTYYLSQVYTAPSVPPAIPDARLPLVMSVAAGVVFSPLMVLVSFLLRVAVVTLYTVSVGPFVPPVESTSTE